MNASEDDRGAALPRIAPDRIASQRVGGVHADANNVARFDGLGIESLERFVDDRRRAVVQRRRSRKNIQPPRGDDCRTERDVRRIDNVDAHLCVTQKDRAMDLLSLVKKPAVATAAFCDPRPMPTPASAAAPQGVGSFVADAADGREPSTTDTGSSVGTDVTDPGNSLTLTPDEGAAIPGTGLASSAATGGSIVVGRGAVDCANGADFCCCPCAGRPPVVERPSGTGVAGTRT